MSKIVSTKFVCDRCGTSTEREHSIQFNGNPPSDWRILQVNANHIHICDKCVITLNTWLENEGMEGSKLFLGLDQDVL